ncbi:bifunctional adenosylcobinamide kinase/adenosylcobinamide-phosphate guanylyltransferase [Mediterraneibacter gnavus]|uniref:bifunctional adenosylcobinamide kinase/adenosylcobinamide-phosphate guanylyltransferase n=1 Tax=Mediterraneibacter gnavus TaxID=33038 RepID=UPI002285D041|nr:bifunctional adenosylcobinamide kinase/adenosylcobinamide-phosphate guanylyltransferase [Mediterraneibacter gnavus]MCZ0639917.1 bifunctional adenosylcobinamide kinase/adenosylcobinamide-phosphate guanylyltransferase [Mediterraneibacter gnavus]
MFHVVTGGSGSGKSAYAEEQICMLKKKTNSRHLYYIATMVPYGKETEQKILRHRQMRNGKGFETLECFTDLKKLVQTEPGFRADAAEEGICVLLECMSNLTANELYLDTGAKERTREAVLEGIRELEKRCRGLVAVTNEVFCDLPPADEEMQEYLSVLGTINCRLAKMAYQVTEVVYGIPVEVKKG